MSVCRHEEIRTECARCGFPMPGPAERLSRLTRLREQEAILERRLHEQERAVLATRGDLSAVRGDIARLLDLEHVED